MHIATICARNYLPRARVLAESFREQVPDGTMTALVVDALPGDPAEGLFDVLLVEDILDADEFARMATAYDIVEFSTAVKPTLLHHLLDSSTVVHYVDPDVRFHGDPTFLDDHAREWGIVLTPHLTTPPQRVAEGFVGGEDVVLPAGTFNLGYLGLSRSGAEVLLPWWRRRLSRECLRDPQRSRFVDQRWMDLAPGYFRHYVERHPGVNVAWWNLQERPITRHDGQWQAAGKPLIFLHASGIDPHRPHEISVHHGDDHPFRPPADAPERALLDDYRAAVIAAGHDSVPPPEAGLRRLEGLHLTREERRSYLDSLVRHESHGGPEPPNPFRNGMPAFFEWAGRRHPAADSIPSPGGVRRPGISLIGSFSEPSGTGMVGRLIAGALANRNAAFATYDLHAHRLHEITGRVPWRDIPGDLFDTTIICANAADIPIVNHRLHPDLRAATRVGVWWWETEEAPDHFSEALALVDEVWTGSDFTRVAIAAHTDIPVKVIPVPVVVTANPTTDLRRRLAVDDGAFLVASVISLDSVFERKNPLGVIDAYRRAFNADEGAALVLKVTGHDDGTRIDQLRFAAHERPDIRIIHSTWPTEDVHGLLASSDCLLSLHRSEGFGLTMAEALAYGRPVIGTGYGGNLQFMDDSCAFLVPWTPCRITRDAAPYTPGGRWANPDLDAAASLLRVVRAHPDEAARRANVGRERMHRDHSPERTGEVIESLLEQRRQPPDTPAPRRRRMPRRRSRTESPRAVRPMESMDAAFHHSMDLPDGRHVEGDWTLTDMDSYLGHVPLGGRRVLDAGTATGALAFAAESRGAREVVALDPPLDVPYDPRHPVDEEVVRRALAWRAGVRRGFHACHDALGSSVRHVTGDLQHLRGDLGRFDVTIMGNVLQTLRDPACALLAVARISNVVVVTVADWMHGQVPDDIAALITLPTDQPYSWYQARPAWVCDQLEQNGFADLSIQHHVQQYNGHPSAADGSRPEPVEVPHFTVVGWHENVPQRDRRIARR